MSDQLGRDAPVVLRELRKIAAWVLPMVPFVCSLFFAAWPSHHLQEAFSDYAQLPPKIDPPPNLLLTWRRRQAGGVHKGRLKLPKKGLVGQGMEGEESGPLLQYSNSRPQRRGPYTFPGQEFQQTWQRPLGYLLQPLWGEDIVLQGGIFIRLLGETGECHGKSSPWLNAHRLCLLS